MASEYFGLKGKLVKQYQDILNMLGADIKVNGKWGKKTEAAFNKYRDSFLEAIGAKQSEEENPYTPVAFTPRTDEALAQQAQNRYGTLYDADIERLERAARDKEQAQQSQIESLDPAYAQRAQALSGQYAAKRQTLSDEALSRGLGRSSYVTDRIAGSQKSELSELSALEAEKQNKKEELQSAISQGRGDLTDSTNRLLSERESKILGAIDEYRKSDRDAADDALRYNNQINQQYREEQERKREFQQELLNALRLARIKK